VPPRLRVLVCYGRAFSALPRWRQSRSCREVSSRRRTKVTHRLRAACPASSLRHAPRPSGSMAQIARERRAFATRRVVRPLKTCSGGNRRTPARCSSPDEMLPRRSPALDGFSILAACSRRYSFAECRRIRGRLSAAAGQRHRTPSGSKLIIQDRASSGLDCCNTEAIPLDSPMVRRMPPLDSPANLTTLRANRAAALPPGDRSREVPSHGRAFSKCLDTTLRPISGRAYVTTLQISSASPIGSPAQSDARFRLQPGRGDRAIKDPESLG